MNINGGDNRSKFVVFMYETVIQYQRSMIDVQTGFKYAYRNAIDVIVHAQGKVSSSVLIQDPDVISNHSRHKKPHQNAQC